MAVEFNQLEGSAREKMDKSISVFKSDLATIRAGRANPQVLDKITVDYYGVSTPINQDVYKRQQYAKPRGWALR